MLVYFETFHGKSISINPNHVVGIWLDEHDNVVIGTVLDNFTVRGTFWEVNQKLSGFVIISDNCDQDCLISTTDISAIYGINGTTTNIRFRSGEIMQLDKPFDHIRSIVINTTSPKTDYPIDAF